MEEENIWQKKCLFIRFLHNKTKNVMILRSNFRQAFYYLNKSSLIIVFLLHYIKLKN